MRLPNKVALNTVPINSPELFIFTHLLLLKTNWPTTGENGQFVESRNPQKYLPIATQQFGTDWSVSVSFLILNYTGPTNADKPAARRILKLPAIRSLDGLYSAGRFSFEYYFSA